MTAYRLVVVVYAKNPSISFFFFPNPSFVFTYVISLRSAVKVYDIFVPRLSSPRMLFQSLSRLSNRWETRSRSVRVIESAYRSRVQFRLSRARILYYIRQFPSRYNFRRRDWARRTVEFYPPGGIRGGGK